MIRTLILYASWIAVPALGLYVLAECVDYVLYHLRARRKERRLIRTCDKAFGRGNYRLDRLRISKSRDWLAQRLLPFGTTSPPHRPYTYLVTPAENRDPDYSGMSRREIARLKHYLGPRDVIHHGKKPIRRIRSPEDSEELA